MNFTVCQTTNIVTLRALCRIFPNPLCLLTQQRNIRKLIIGYVSSYCAHTHARSISFWTDVIWSIPLQSLMRTYDTDVFILRVYAGVFETTFWNILKRNSDTAYK